MKGRLSYEKWSVADLGINSYYAERMVNGKSQTEYISAHCLACAKSDVLARFGGQVDTRGWHMQGSCGSFLKTRVTSVDSEESLEGDKFS